MKLLPFYGYDTILTITDYDILKASIFLLYTESIDAVGIIALYTTYSSKSSYITESPYESSVT